MPGRLVVIEVLIEHAKSKLDVWFATLREVAEWTKANAQ